MVSRECARGLPTYTELLGRLGIGGGVFAAVRKMLGEKTNSNYFLPPRLQVGQSPVVPWGGVAEAEFIFTSEGGYML